MGQVYRLEDRDRVERGTGAPSNAQGRPHKEKLPTSSLLSLTRHRVETPTSKALSVTEREGGHS